MNGIGHVDNSIVINADLDLVWDVTNDVERWPTLFTEYSTAEILEREGDSLRFRLTMHPDENGTAWSWVSERTTDRAGRRVKARRKASQTTAGSASPRSRCAPRRCSPAAHRAGARTFRSSPRSAMPRVFRSTRDCRRRSNGTGITKAWRRRHSLS